jgi:hypothetical protein
MRPWSSESLGVIELQAEGPRRKLLDTREVADWLGVEPEAVRTMADDLGAWRLPSEKGRGRLRFDPAEIERRLRPENGRAEIRQPSLPRQQAPGSRVALLPIREGKTE